MHIHYCGSPAHDIPMFILSVLNFAPDWMPVVAAVRDDLKRRVRAAH